MRLDTCQGKMMCYNYDEDERNDRKSIRFIGLRWSTNPHFMHLRMIQYVA